MNRSDFVAILSDIHESRTALLINKGADYATDDVLSNFKRVHAVCKELDINPSSSSTDAALFLIVLKIDRWCNLRRAGAKPKNESVKDTIKDLHNYVDLAYACQVEEKNDP